MVALTSGLYHTTIKSVEAYQIMNKKFTDHKIFMLWYVFVTLDPPWYVKLFLIPMDMHYWINIFFGHAITLAKCVHKRTWSLDNLIHRSMLNFHHFYKEFKRTYMGLFNYLVIILVFYIFEWCFYKMITCLPLIDL